MRKIYEIGKRTIRRKLSLSLSFIVLTHFSIIFCSINLFLNRKVKNMPKYSKKSQKTVKNAMDKFKKGDLKSGKNGQIVKSRKQAIAIGLSEAREKGAKVPRKA